METSSRAVEGGGDWCSAGSGVKLGVIIVHHCLIFRHRIIISITYIIIQPWIAQMNKFWLVRQFPIFLADKQRQWEMISDEKSLLPSRLFWARPIKKCPTFPLWGNYWEIQPIFFKKETPVLEVFRMAQVCSFIEAVRGRGWNKELFQKWQEDDRGKRANKNTMKYLF